MATGKSPDAFRTIGELSQELGVAQHILRYWETRFPQLKPLQRAGNRRYYRQADVDLVRRINRLLNQEGYTVRGVQQLLRTAPSLSEPLETRGVESLAAPAEPAVASSVDVGRLIQLRDRLVSALDA
jgi:DNA-binding transcriptional MerR regulator